MKCICIGISLFTSFFLTVNASLSYDNVNIATLDFHVLKMIV